MANIPDAALEGLRSRIKDQCAGCPRDQSKLPVVFRRKSTVELVEFVIISQEPGFWLRSLVVSDKVELRLEKLCKEGKEGTPAYDECKKANPLIKVLEIFGNFDPTMDKVYWTHALKCVPAATDKDINKEWRKVATKCEDHLIEELRTLGRTELNLVVFGKFALEMCLHILDGQDINQELSISEFMQGSRLPLSYKYKFKDGTIKTINMFVFTNPSSEVVKIKKSGGKLTVEEIQDLEVKRLRELNETEKKR